MKKTNDLCNSSLFDSKPTCSTTSTDFPIFIEKSLSKKEKLVVKTFLWFHLYSFLAEKFKLNSLEKEMIDPDLTRILIIELIKDGEYTLDGLAYATRIPLDVINDIAYGINTNPSTSTTLQIIWHYIISKHTVTEKLRATFQLLDTKH